MPTRLRSIAGYVGRWIRSFDRTSAVDYSDCVFLSHAGADTQAARQLAEILRRSGLKVWFDKDCLQPGDSWMAELEKAIEGASAMIVYIGKHGVQAWVDREVRYGLVRNTETKGNFRFVPVLGEGAELSKLPPFVQQHQCVNLRDGQTSPEQIRRLIEVLRTPSAQGAIPVEHWTTKDGPFRSLREFSPEDSWLFFGRDRDTDDLLACLDRAPTLVVIGNSGSGKSSLIQAGLIPALQRGRFRQGGKWVESWRVAIFRPSASPFDSLAEALPGQLAPEESLTERVKLVEDCKSKLPKGGDALRNVIAACRLPGARVLLVADQFEALFTLVEDKAARDRYIDLLLAAARPDGPVPVYLVLSLRADFYANCLDYPKLLACLNTNVFNVNGMNPEQLREAVEKRLAMAGAGAESGLINSLISDVGTEPGNLALLEHALGQLWERSGGSGHTLTNDAYAQIGRLKGAVGKHADEVYGEIEKDGDGPLVQKVFLQLVQPGEGGAHDTRRRVAKASLLQFGAPERVERLIARLASSRLVATSSSGLESPAQSFVEVSHEALIREWPALRGWLDENRPDLLQGRRLVQAAEEWEAQERNPGWLLREARLKREQAWLDKHPEASPLLRDFLDASRQARNRAQEQSRTQAAEAERKLVEDRHEALDLAMRAWETAKTAEANAAVARAFPQLLVELGDRLKRHAAFSPDGQRILTDSIIDRRVRVWNASNGQLVATLEGQTDSVALAAFSPHGQRVVTASDDYTARVWDAANGQLLAKLEGQVTCAAFSPDGQRIVTVSDDGTARVWNAGNGQLLAAFEGHGDYVLPQPGTALPIMRAAFSPDGQRIVTTIDYCTAWVWNAGNGQPLASLQDTDSFFGVTFSPDGERILAAGCENDTAQVWNAATGELLTTLEGHADWVADAAFSSDGERIVTASADHTARVWNAADGQPLATVKGHGDCVWQAAFSRDGRRIVTASNDKTARVWNWNAVDGQLLAELGHEDRVEQAAFLPDGQRVVTASRDGTARVWGLANALPAAKLKGHTDNVWFASFSPDGRHIATASVDTTARVWNAADGELLATLQGHEGRVWLAAFSPDGRRIVTASDDVTARLWDASNGQRLVTLEGHGKWVVHAAFSPDSQRIVTASKDQTARVWSAADGQLLARLTGHSGGVRQAAFSPHGQRIVTASEDHTARVWNAANGQLLATLEGHKGRVWHATFCLDGKRIVTASEDHTARLWNAADGEPIAELIGHTHNVWLAASSPDGQRIVTASEDHTARVWDAANGQLVATLEGHKGRVWHATFCLDGEHIVTASEDKSARVWNVANGQMVVRLEGHKESVGWAAFSTDGHRIVTASADATARVYRILTLADLGELLGR